MDIRAKEDLDREGFAKQPQEPDEWEPWQEVIAWPEEETELRPKSQSGPQAKPRASPPAAARR